MVHIHINKRVTVVKLEDEFSQHMPKSLQMMLKIERLAQERLRQIEKSIEDGETTLDAVKRERGLL